MNHRSRDVDQPPKLIDLAREPAFRLGEAQVQPPTREVIADGRRQVVEPRVMQVLVALARRQGKVVSRDELIAFAWGGRAVGDDAINRAISGVRRVAKDCRGFAIETIARVGYRLGATDVSEPITAVPAPARLAVLPFDNLSADPELLYFSEGVSEEILQTVARATDLKVIGRSSSFQFRGAAKAAASAELQATHILDGSVRRSGAQVRITAQLVECATQTTLWTQRFDGRLTDVFALQDEIAAAVAAALNIAFEATAPLTPVSSTAYDLYLRARGLVPYDIELAVTLLEQATKLEPEFAPAWAALANAVATRGRFMSPEGFPDPARAIAGNAARRALQLDPRSGMALASLSVIEAFGRYAERDEFLRSAVAADAGDPTVLQVMASFCISVGRFREGFGFAARARELDPLSARAAHVYELCLGPLGLWEECARICDAARGQWPEFVEAFTNDALVYAAFRNQWQEFDRLAMDALAIASPSQGIRWALFAGRALRDPNLQIRTRVLTQLRDQLARSGTVLVGQLVFAHRLGLRDEAFELIDEASFDEIFDARAASPGGRYNTGSIFFLDPQLSRDSRFPRLCAKLGLCDYWVKTGRWPDCTDELPYDFRTDVIRHADRRL